MVEFRNLKDRSGQPNVVVGINACITLMADISVTHPSGSKLFLLHEGELGRGVPLSWEAQEQRAWQRMLTLLGELAPQCPHGMDDALKAIHARLSLADGRVFGVSDGPIG